MGNKAIIKPVDMEVGIYLHWNGDRDRVEGFLRYCNEKNYRSFGEDSSCALARLTQVIANFFGGALSIRIVGCKGDNKDAEWLDNGIYVVKGWDIVDRIWYDGKLSDGVRHEEDEETDSEMDRFLLMIDECQPKNEQIGEYLQSHVVNREDVNVGDTVVTYDVVNEKYVPAKVLSKDHDGWLTVEIKSKYGRRTEALSCSTVRIKR